MISGLFSLPMAPASDARGEAVSRAGEFIVGPENSLVRTLAASACEPSPAYNPLVLCGPAGVGKSTLAHLLAERRKQVLGLKNLVLTTSSDLFRALAHATDTNSVADLRTRHHRCDLLVVDDVQRLAGRTAAQQYLAATIDVLVRRGALVIATLRHQPAATDGLLSALASRLSAGLVVPLVPPQLLARRELVRQLAAQVELPLPDEAISRLAESAGKRKSPATAPQLRHAVMQLASAVKHEQKRIGPALVAQVLAADDPGTKALARQVIGTVSKQFQVSVSDLKGPSRQQAIAEARAIAMCLCRRLTEASYAEIGRYFSDRDHTTVLHACRKIEGLASQDTATARLLEELITQITADEPRV